MSEPSFHCNACGREVSLRRSLGRAFKVCSPECLKEMDWRAALSIMRRPYEPSPEAVAMAKRVLERK